MIILPNINTLVFPLQQFGVHRNEISVSVLRLDKLDTYINGNKWFKLKYLLQDAKKQHCDHIVSFGGVWSNHIIALAAACKILQLKSTAFIRSDEKLWTTTLQKAKDLGMHIEFADRAMYAAVKHNTGVNPQKTKEYYIAEGGNSLLGVQGAAEMMDINELDTFNHIICPVGTGTTFAGILNKLKEHQKCIGINALKGGSFQEKTINEYSTNTNYEMINTYHFGGFARYTDVLLSFMRDWYTQTQIPTDIVYTGKMFFGLNDMLEKKYFGKEAKILVIHTGGLQGNASLPNGLLNF
jgi:1-aminocyclopropane-1-carboxylate deaminase